jgi:hypothetical protein
MIEVKLLKYVFQFRRLSWREEFALKFGKEDPRKVTLAAALDNVSGTKTTFEDAMRIFGTIPPAVMQRAYIIYRYKLPKARIFSTRHLYKAPEPLVVMRRVEEEETQQDQAADALHRQMENTFGREELKEQQNLEREIFRKADPRYVERRTTDPDNDPMGSWKAGGRKKK